RQLLRVQLVRGRRPVLVRRPERRGTGNREGGGASHQRQGLHVVSFRYGLKRTKRRLGACSEANLSFALNPVKEEEPAGVSLPPPSSPRRRGSKAFGACVLRSLTARQRRARPGRGAMATAFVAPASQSLPNAPRQPVLRPCAKQLACAALRLKHVLRVRA